MNMIGNQFNGKQISCVYISFKDCVILLTRFYFDDYQVPRYVRRHIIRHIHFFHADASDSFWFKDFYMGGSIVGCDIFDIDIAHHGVIEDDLHT